MIFVAFAFWFLPLIIALARGNSNVGGVFLVNLFLSWTIVGWFVALMMAFVGDRKPQPVYIVAGAAPSYVPQETYGPMIDAGNDYSDYVGSRSLIPLPRKEN